jgi:hypothetical protein
VTGVDAISERYYRTINFYVGKVVSRPRAGGRGTARVDGATVAGVAGISLRGRGSRAPWSWEQVRERTLAVYATDRGARTRVAVLAWQGDDPRVAVDGARPPLLVFTLDVEHEADEHNTVALAGYDSLEAARARCVEWAGAATEVGWDGLGEAAQIGLYASIREPGFADRG